MTKKMFFTMTLLFGLLASALFISQPVSAQREHNGERLENFYKRLILVEEGIQFRIQRAENIVAKTGEFIARLNEHAVDTTELSIALDNYVTAINSAKSNAANGKAILDSSAGFDGEGNVTDLQTAFQTVRDAARALGDAHWTLLYGTLDFQEAVRTFRQQYQD
jgi:hypothetical protein